MPLLLVTRPQPQADAWVQALNAQGLAAAALPLIEIADASEPAALAAAWQRLPLLSFVMFVSGNAVDRFFARRPLGATWPLELVAGATGPGTAQALLAAGLSHAQVVLPEPGGGDAVTPPTWDAEALWRRIADGPWCGRQVLVVRGEQGRDWLAEQWREAGAEVHFVEAYRRQSPRWSLSERATCAAALREPQAHLWLFSSSESIRHLQALAGTGADWAASAALATHPRIADAARSIGFDQVRLVAPELDSVARALREGDGLTLPTAPGP